MNIYPTGTQVYIRSVHGHDCGYPAPATVAAGPLDPWESEIAVTMFLLGTSRENELSTPDQLTYVVLGHDSIVEKVRK